jgi:hypothetical protein
MHIAKELLGNSHEKYCIDRLYGNWENNRWQIVG